MFGYLEKTQDSEKIKDEEKRRCNYKQFEIIDNGDQKPKFTKKNRWTQKKLIEYKNHYGLN